ncbi:MAG: membrane protein insertase YidC [Acidobacteriota bacterium]
MDIRRLLLAFVLSLGILLTWNYFFPVQPVRPPGDEIQPVPAVEEALPVEAALDESEVPEVAEGAATESEEEARLGATAEERVVVDTERFRAELSNRGAVLLSFRLKNHRTAEGDDVDLVRFRQGGLQPFALVAGGSASPLELNRALFEVEDLDGEGERQVVFRYRGPLGAAEKSFHFRRDGFLETKIEVERPQDWNLWLGPGLRNPTLDELDNRFGQERGGVYRLGGDMERVEAKKGFEPEVLPGTGMTWVGLEDHYFLTASIPSPATPLRGVVFEPLFVLPGADGRWSFEAVPPKDALTKEQKDLQTDYALLLQPTSDRIELENYWGAKDIRRLSKLPYGLDETITLGIFGFFARLLFAGLMWIYENVVPNYGWSIVLLTTAIKIVLAPLTHKSYKSARRMQELSPKMQAIRSRYRPKLKDKQGRPNMEAQRKMNEEIMALYKSEGVNPAGGCLPMLLQLPVLFAFYRLLGAAVELRNAPWLGWIKDLSVADPYYALPLIMGGTQFLQQRMTPMGGDPMQRRIFQLMPVFMTFLFLNFPSGLVLYWLTNNVLTIAQQGAYNWFKERGTDKAKAAKKG